MKKKKLIISICVVCIVLVRIFTPYLGKPFLIKCKDQMRDNGFHLSNKVREIWLDSDNDPCIKYIKYCTELEALHISEPLVNTNEKPLNLEKVLDPIDASNPNLKSIGIHGECINWSSLNKLTGLKELYIRPGNFTTNFTTVEDISELKKLETLSIFGSGELSLKNLNELKSLKELELWYVDDIDCEDLSQLENLETLNLNPDGKISGLDKMDTVKSLTLYYHTDPEIGNDICGMDSLEEVTIYDFKLSEEVESALREKGVSIYHKG